jgi:hypothetical protein
MNARTNRRSRLTLQSLENRDVPATFNIANGDTAGFIAAIGTCNTNNQADTINLAANGTYTFTAVADATEGGSALPTILRDAADTNTVTINGNGALLQRSSAAGTPNFRLLRIGAFPNIIGVTLNNISFANGNAGTNNGGGVELAAGDLTVNNCSFASNQGANGGGIYATNTTGSPRALSISGSTFSGNVAANGDGGGVYSVGTTNVSVTAGTFTINSATSDGGALRVQTSSATTTVLSSLFANNSTTGNGGGGGAILIQGTSTITDSTIRDNICMATGSGGGGGLWVQLASTSTATITGTTVSGNRVNNSTASGGGIFEQGGNVILVNSTIYNNRAGSGGGLAVVNGTMTGSITNSTITNNSAFFTIATGGGVSIANGSVVSMANTIVAGNILESGGTGPDIGGPVTSAGYNLIQDTSGATITGNATGNIYGVSPNLGPLQLNGGPTATRMPNAGSPVINAGDPAFVPPPANDQRGPGYVRVFGGRIDIGAVEVASPHILSTQVNDGSAQRSRVTSLTITFDTPVTFAGAPEAAFTLTRNSDNAVVGFTPHVSTVNGETVVVLDSFTGSATDFGSLADGRYTLTAVAGQISSGGLALDGGSGTGTNYTFSDGQGLFRMFGDVNGDQTVNGFDLGFFRSAFGTAAGDPNYLSYLDINGDGVINGFDLGQFRTRFGTMLP